MINHATGIDQAMLTRKIDVKRISLIELAAQNKDILAILETKILQPETVVEIVKLYQAWYDLLASLSSTSPNETHKISLKENHHRDVQQDLLNDDGLTFPEHTIPTLATIYNTFDKYQNLSASASGDNRGQVYEKQKVFNTVRRLFHEMVHRLAKANPLFECHPEFVGSSREGTRAYMPDEFDVKFICTEIIKYIDITSPRFELQVSAVVQLFVKPEYRSRSDIKPYVLPNGHFDAHKYKTDFDTLLTNILIDIFNEGNFCQYMFLESQFICCSNITNFNLKWRGETYKDMTISVDVVPAVLCERLYSLFCPQSREGQFYVFFKYKSEDCFPVDHSDVELKSICQLPDNCERIC